MQLVKLIIAKKSNPTVYYRCLAVVFFITTGFFLHAQENSPYSRYGLGDKAASTNVANRGLGGVSAAFYDYFNVNYNNPASYSFFQANQEAKSKKINSGRAVLNVAINNEGRTLIDPKVKQRFSTNNILYSSLNVGAPIRKNWGMAFGLRQMHNIDYKIVDSNKIINSGNAVPIDRGQTLYEGNGGLHLGYIGTGVKFKLNENQYLSLGTNLGYLFGKKDYITRRSLNNDSTAYEDGFIQNKTTIGGVYLDAGVQYQFKIGNNLYMGLGAYGNLQQKLKATKDYIAGTYAYSSTDGYVNLDTVQKNLNTKGEILYPSGFTAGFIIQKTQNEFGKTAGWMIGADITRNNWDNYKFFGVADNNVKSNWQAKVGAELRPVRKASYFSNVAYRVGFNTGPDYIYLKKALPTYGLSMGMTLPLANYNQQAQYQASVINLALEYIKRGNKENVLHENLYRISVGFSLTDLWFGKRRYSN